ncbi:1-deoxy-D-xylulose-5-phosphate synthase 1 [Planctomycetota bacterium]|nr:1-deoxy-D-xylulose-5-phosphate synthase 1 [Planctomycetota bacterium]
MTPARGAPVVSSPALVPPPPILDGLLSPADLRRLTAAELAQLGDEIRHRIKTVVSANGGHLSSNLGTVELTIALHRVFDFTADRLLWDVGHQAYPHKLLTGRARNFHTNRTRDGLSGFPDPQESPYDLAKVGHSSTGISTGVGVAEAYRRLGQKRRTVVVVGDGALTGGMAFEGLINAGQLKSDLLVILNDNGTFIDAPVGSLHTHLDRIRTGRLYNHIRTRFLSTLKGLWAGAELERFAEQLEHAAHKVISPGYIFEDLGFRYFGPIDGHDLHTVEDNLKRIATLCESGQADRPVLLHVLTRKGGGWEPSAKDPLKFHGPRGFNIDSGEFLPKPPAAKTYSQIFAEACIELAAEDERVVAITAAMPTGTGLLAFGKKYPDRLYDVGICEQHSFAFAQGLAIAGLHPILGHYSSFAQRGYDQLFQELVVNRDLGVVVTLDRAGMVGEDGETHHGLYDIAWARCLPGLVLMAPKDGPELRSMLRWAHAERLKPRSERAAGYLIRYPREEAPDFAVAAPIAQGKAEVLADGKADAEGRRPLLIWAYGAAVRFCRDALADLGDRAAGVTLVNARFAKPLDSELLAAQAAHHDRLLTVEDHALAGGFGSVVAEAVADLGLSIPMTRLGVRDELVAHATRDQQLAAHGLDRAGLAARIATLIAPVLDRSQSVSIPFPRSA